jgi:hypothetical protein
MRAIIISDKDAKYLLNELRFEKMNIHNNDRYSVEDMHRAFHYIVCKWLQDQGADVSP